MTSHPPRRRLGALTLLVLTLLVVACSSDSERANHAAAETPAATVAVAAAAAVPPVTEPPASTTLTPTASTPTLQAGGVTAAKREASLSLIGRINLPGARGSVRVLGQHAFVGAGGFGNSCPNGGVAVVDISDPTQPTLAATAVRAPGASTEDVAVLRVATTAFSGDLLAAGLQACAPNGPKGLALADVSDPANPVDLAVFPTPAASRGVHELHLFARADGRVLALLAASNSERSGVGDFQIVDVSDPRRPTLLATWSAARELGVPVGSVRTGVCGVSGAYVHSVRASADGTRAYLSYFDAGVVILDISDPTAPRFLGRIFAPDSPAFFEGAFHSAVEGPDRTLVVTQEIGYPFGPGPGMLVRAEGAGQAVEVPACVQEGRNTVTQPLSGPLVGVPSCDATLTDAAGAVALFRDDCDLTTLLPRARAAGVAALLLVDEDEPNAGSLRRALDGGPPRVWLSRARADQLWPLAERGDATLALPSQRQVGGVSVWDIRDPAAPAPLATYHTENAGRFPPPAGIFSAHEPVVVGRLAAISWYRDGVRLLDLSDPRRPVEVAAWAGEPGAVLQGWWGVAVAGDLVLGSDFNGELWVLRLT